MSCRTRRYRWLNRTMQNRTPAKYAKTSNINAAAFSNAKREFSGKEVFAVSDFRSTASTSAGNTDAWSVFGWPAAATALLAESVTAA